MPQKDEFEQVKNSPIPILNEKTAVKRTVHFCIDLSQFSLGILVWGPNVVFPKEK